VPRVTPGSLGYIWIATDRGLVRYDGYDFKTYGIQEGLEDISCLNIRIEENGDIWILTLSGRVFQYESQSDNIQPYRHQPILDSFLRVTKILDFGISKDRALSFVLEGIGFLDLYSDERLLIYRGESREYLATLITKEINSGRLVVSNNRRGPAKYIPNEDIRKVNYGNYIAEDFEIQHLNIRIKGTLDREMNISSIEAFHLLDDVILLAIKGVDYYIENDTVLIRKHQNEIDDIKVINDTSFVTCELNKKGVSFYNNYAALLENKKKTIIRDVSSTCSLLDQDDNIWITTTDRGLFKLERKLINAQVSAVTTNHQVTHIVQGHSTIYYVLGKNALYKRSWQDTDSLVLFDHSDRINSLTFNEYKDELIICKNQAKLFSKGNKFSLINYTDPVHLPAIFPASMTEAFVLVEDEILITTPSAFLVYNDLKRLQHYYSFGKEDPLRVLGAERIAKGHYLLGTVNGLFEFENQVIKELVNRPEMLRSRINDIKKIGDKYLFATLGYGLVFWDLENDPIVVTRSEGLLSNNVEQIFIDDKEHIYLSTKAGLCKLWFDDNDSLHVKNYTTFHGLPSNEVNDVAEWNDTIYLATGVSAP